PEQLLLCLPVQAMHVLDASGSVSVRDIRLLLIERTAHATELEVSVRLRVRDLEHDGEARLRIDERVDDRPALNGIPEPEEDAQRENDHRLVARQYAALLQVGLCVALAGDGEDIGAVLDVADEHARGADERVTERLMNALSNVGELGHG